MHLTTVFLENVAILEVHINFKAHVHVILCILDIFYLSIVLILQKLIISVFVFRDIMCQSSLKSFGQHILLKWYVNVTISPVYSRIEYEEG